MTKPRATNDVGNANLPSAARRHCCSLGRSVTSIERRAAGHATLYTPLPFPRLSVPCTRMFLHSVGARSSALSASEPGILQRTRPISVVTAYLSAHTKPGM